MNYKDLVTFLTENKKTMASMESCTGGALVNEITNIEGASQVLKFSAVTYANEFKIKMGILSNTIEKHTVYSDEVAREMSKKISEYAKADYGVGITGKLNRRDNLNPYGEDNVVFISVYDLEEHEYSTAVVKVLSSDRVKNKELILDNVLLLFQKIIKKSK